MRCSIAERLIVVGCTLALALGLFGLQPAKAYLPCILSVTQEPCWCNVHAVGSPVPVKCCYMHTYYNATEQEYQYQEYTGTKNGCTGQGCCFTCPIAGDYNIMTLIQQIGTCGLPVSSSQGLAG